MTQLQKLTIIFHIAQFFQENFFTPVLDVSKEILVGNVNLMLGYAEDLYSANVTITSKEEECFKHFDWEIKEKKNFKLNFNGNIQIPDSNYETDPLCKKGQKSNGMPEQKFKIWEELIDDQSGEQNLGFQMLFHLKPDTSPMDPTKVKQKFLSDMTYFSEGPNIHVNMSVWEGPISTWKMQMGGSFDTQDQLHGICHFVLISKFINETGKHDFLDWSLEHFSGNFVHGKLQGIALLVTWRGVQMFATFKDGELHGPVSALGRKFLYDVEVK